jgi:hypothetical protein
LPAYLNFVSHLSGGTFSQTNHGSNPTRKALQWTFGGLTSLQPFTIEYTAQAADGAVASQPLFVNTAWVTASDTLKVQVDSATYHQGAGVAVVTFSAGVGGIIFGHEPQAVDYRTTARTGVVVAPDEGYGFIGWSHDSYISLRGDVIPAADGIMRYDTLTIYGDVELRAEFAPFDRATANAAVETLHATSLQQPAIWAHNGELFVNIEPLQRFKNPASGSDLTTLAAVSNPASGSDLTTLAAVSNPASGSDKVTRLQGNILRIYTTDGVLFKQQTILNKGITTIKLPSGIYICTLNNGVGTKVVIN